MRGQPIKSKQSIKLKDINPNICRERLNESLACRTHQWKFMLLACLISQSPPAPLLFLHLPLFPLPSWFCQKKIVIKNKKIDNVLGDPPVACTTTSVRRSPHSSRASVATFSPRLQHWGSPWALMTHLWRPDHTLTYHTRKLLVY